jgi:drug/metabolite transporter (DMT)-like permease
MCGSTTLLWILLQRVPLLRVNPFATPGFVLVPLASAWLFDKRITWSDVLGATCVVVGIVIIRSSEWRAWVESAAAVDHAGVR